MVALATESASPERTCTPKTPIGDQVQLSGLRYYNPDMGRWINRDPIGEAAFREQSGKGLSRSERRELQSAALEPSYTFVGNGPSDDTDFLGLQGQTPTEDVLEKACIWCACSVPPVPGAATKVVVLKGAVEKSKKDAKDKYPRWKGADEPEYNAYLHCIGSCRSVRAVGPACAIGTQLCHEKYGGGNFPRDTKADHHNNSVGNRLALKFGSCHNLCMGAMKNGKLDCKERVCDVTR